MHPEMKAMKRGISKGVFPTCHLCGKLIEKPEEFSQDHLIPKCISHDSSIYNLAPAHVKCNGQRGNMPLAYWFMRQAQNQRS